MPWRGPEYAGEFPTLGYQVADLIEAQCVVPDGDLGGQPFRLTDEQLKFLVFFYRIDPSVRWDSRTQRWRRPFAFPRGGQLVRPQKWGKGPLSAAWICAEAHPEGPVLFDGWDANGEPVGRPWATPWIQLAALSEKQTENVWLALLPMIRRGPLADVFYDVGDTRIQVSGDDSAKIEYVTSSAGSRLGQRITAALQDEPHSYTEGNGGRKLADTQRRNLSGMGGRFLETTNAWDPSEGSVAEATRKEPGVYFDDVEPGPGSIRNKRDRRRMLKRVYGDSHWVDLDRIDDEIVALLPRDPAQAERFYTNRKRAGESVAFNLDVYKAKAQRRDADERALVAIGVDGARVGDALGVVAKEIVPQGTPGLVWPLGIWERDEAADDEYEHPFDEVDSAMVEAFDRFTVVRVYVDPQHIEELLRIWQGRWGQKLVTAWRTNRNTEIAWAVRRYTEGLARGTTVARAGTELDGVLERHHSNAVKHKLPVFDDRRVQMHTLAKLKPGHYIDGAMAGVLAEEAALDAIGKGALQRKPKRKFDLSTYKLRTIG